jgi:uncharacterized membrane protein HdeD (DUF308 family)
VTDLIRAPGWFVLLRDLVTLVLGVFIIVNQTLNNYQNYPLLGVATILLGVPGAANLLWAVKNTDIEQPSQVPPSSDSASDSIS